MLRFPHSLSPRAVPLALALTASGCSPHLVPGLVNGPEKRMKEGIQLCHATMQSPPSTQEDLDAQEAAYANLVDKAFDENIELYNSETLYTPSEGARARTYADWSHTCREFFYDKTVEFTKARSDALPDEEGGNETASNSDATPTSTAESTSPASTSVSGINRSSCTFKGKKLQGRVKVVKTFGDIKVRLVQTHGHLLVQKVNSLANSCGRWQMVEGNGTPADLTVQFVNLNEDFTIEYTNSFPGVSTLHQ